MRYLHQSPPSEEVNKQVMNIWTYRDHGSIHRTAQMGFQHWEGRWTWGPTSIQEAIYNWDPLAKGKITFFQLNLTEYINHTSGQAPCPGIVNQHKPNSMVFLYNFALLGLFLAYWYFACLFWFFSFCEFSFCFYSIFLLLKERKKNNIKLDW